MKMNWCNIPEKETLINLTQVKKIQYHRDELGVYDKEVRLVYCDNQIEVISFDSGVLAGDFIRSLKDYTKGVL